jgi:hypothetical protein
VHAHLSGSDPRASKVSRVPSRSDKSSSVCEIGTVSPYSAKNIKPSELTFRILLADGAREIRLERIATS